MRAKTSYLKFKPSKYYFPMHNAKLSGERDKQIESENETSNAYLNNQKIIKKINKKLSNKRSDTTTKNTSPLKYLTTYKKKIRTTGNSQYNISEADWYIKSMRN